MIKKPCPKCLRARQRARDLAATLAGGRGRLTLVESTAGDFTINNTTHRVETVSHQDLDPYVGMEVYISGRKLLHVATAEPIGGLGTILKTSRID